MRSWAHTMAGKYKGNSHTLYLSLCEKEDYLAVLLTRDDEYYSYYVNLIEDDDFKYLSKLDDDEADEIKKAEHQLYVD